MRNPCERRYARQQLGKIRGNVKRLFMVHPVLPLYRGMIEA